MRVILLLVPFLLLPALGRDRKKAPPPSPLEQYVREAMARGEAAAPDPSGSLWRANAPLLDIGRDLRARFVDDIVTIVVAERASAVSTGNAKSSRKSAANASVNAAAGTLNPLGAMANLAGLSSSQSLDGQGATARDTSLTTTISARVTQVLPNGYLVIEGAKEVQVNSERQQATVKGVARWNDITSANTISSDRLAQMEVRINGKGIVGDAIRRPNVLYRILLGILPF